MVQNCVLLGCDIASHPTCTETLNEILFYLYVNGLFNDTASDSEHIASNAKIIVNNKLEQAQKEVAVT